MDTDHKTSDRTRSPRLTGTEKTLGVLAVLAASTAGGFGFAQSFEAVSMWGTDAGFLHGWMLPLTVDLLIPSFGILSCLLIRLGMEYRLLRWAPLAMTIATVYLNVNTGSKLSYQVAHGLTAGVFALVTEIGMHYYRAKSGVELGTQMGRVRLARWLLSPGQTFALWRRMVLWEITDYKLAVELERQRLMAIADLEEKYGKGWKKQAPSRLMVGMKLGLTPQQAQAYELGVLDTPEDPAAVALEAAPLPDTPDTIEPQVPAHALAEPAGTHPTAEQPAAGWSPQSAQLSEQQVSAEDPEVPVRRRAIQPVGVAGAVRTPDDPSFGWLAQSLAQARPVPQSILTGPMIGAQARASQTLQSAPDQETESIDPAERLRRIRQAKADGLSQREAARFAQCSPSYVRKIWEQDSRTATTASA